MRPSLGIVVLGVLHLLTMAPASAGLRGDMNNDGKLDARDVQRFVEVLISPADASFEERCAADTSEDLFNTVDDIPPMVSLLLGLIPPQYSVQGHWDTPFDWGLAGAFITPIHMAVVATRSESGRIVGQVYSFGHYGDPNFYLWDPATEQFTPVTFPFGPFNRPCAPPLLPGTATLFCSGHSMLADGKVLHTGGNIQTHGLPCPQGGAISGSTWAFEFDPLALPAGDPWTQVADMAQGRWYPTNTTLPDGRVMTVTGIDACSYCDVNGEPVSEVNTDVEIYTPGAGGSWAVVAQKDIPLYPSMHVVSSGKVFLAGPSNDSETFDLQTSQWTPVAQSQFPFRGNGTSVLLPGNGNSVMIIGGNCCGGVVTDTTEVINLGDPVPQWQSGPSLADPRSHVDAVLLPDGSVVVIGGRRDSGFGPNPDPVYPAEILDPSASTPAWRTMASMCRPRMYHSTAVLLPDGRVLSAGGTSWPPQYPEDERNAQVFYPPYLFNGPRPRIDESPASATYGHQFSVLTPSPSDIVAVVLVRPSAVTHSINMGQRHVALSFSLSPIPESLLVTAPPSANLAPPGYYMLFILRLGADGQTLVPSVAEMIRLDL